MLHHNKSEKIVEKTRKKALLLEDVFKKTEDQNFLRELGYDLKKGLNQRHRDTKTSILHDAVNAERVDIVELLLSFSQDIDINEKDPHTEDVFRSGKTPLLLAITNSDELMVNFLLEKNAKADICDDNGASPLMIAAVRGNPTMLASLLDKGRVDIHFENKSTKDSSTALMYAAKGGLTLNAQFLMDRDASKVNSRKIHVLDCDLTQRTRKKLNEYIQEKEKKEAKVESHSLYQETTAVLTESKKALPSAGKVSPVSQETLSNDLHSLEQDMSQIGIHDKKEQQKKQEPVIQQSADVEAFSKQIKNKDVVTRVTEEFIKKGHVQEAASLLEKTSHSSEISPYWDIDGGFEAMALLGNGFNMKHAHYFMTRITKDPSWRAKPAAGALLKLAEKVTDGPAIQAMIMVMTTLFETKYSGYDDLMEKITTIMGKSTIDSHISALLKSELESPVEMDSNIHTWAEFESAITAKSKKCFSLLEFSCSKRIAMIFDNISTTIHTNGRSINVGSTKDYKTIDDQTAKNFSTSLKQDGLKPKSDFIIKVEQAVSTIPEAKLHSMIYDALQDKNKVVDVAQFVLKNEVIKKETLANLFQRLIQEAPQSIKNYWDVDGGFTAMAMLGSQFNIIHADYFIDRINAGSQQSPAAAVDAIKKLASNITEEGAAAIPALSKIATYLKNNKPMLFNEIKDVLASRFKLASTNDGGIQLTLLKQAKTSKEGLFKQNSSLPASSKTVTLPAGQQTVKTQKKVVYNNRANTPVKLPEQARTSKTGSLFPNLIFFAYLAIFKILNGFRLRKCISSYLKCYSQ